MSSVRSSFFWGILVNYIGLALQLISTFFISRLLTPDEVGIFAIAAVVAQVAMQFRDFGMAEYLIQEKNLTIARIRATFGLNILLSWSMGLLFFTTSWWVADFYRQEGIGELMRLQTLVFLLVPFGGITMAYLRRDLAYKPLFIAAIASSVVSFAVGVGGCALGYSYMALGYANLASLVVTILVSVYYRPAHLPRWPSLKGIVEIAHFSKHAMGIYFFGQVGKNAPEVVIGRAIDVAAAALFSRAAGMIAMFNRTILRAAVNLCLPYFALERREGRSVVDGYLKSVTMLTGVGWPFFAAMAVLSFSAIHLLYGDQWLASVSLAQVLCLVAVLELPYWLSTELLIAVQRVDQSHRLQAITQTVRVLGLVMVLPFGLIGVGWGLSIAALIGGFVAHRFLWRSEGLMFGDVVRACTPSFYVALITAMPAIVVTRLIPQTTTNYVSMFFGCGLLSAVTWLIALRALRHPGWHEISLILGRLWLRLGALKR